MPEITYKEFPAYLEKQGAAAQTYLLFGEELLYKKSFESLLEVLLPSGGRETACEPVDGAPEAIREAIGKANTYSLMPGPKVVTVQESRIFYGSQEKAKFLEKAKEAFQRDDMRKAGRFLLSLLAASSLTLEDMKEEGAIEKLSSGEDGQDATWLTAVIDYCREQNLSVPSGDRPEQLLETALEKGFPRGTFLVLTADLVDKRRTLYKTFKEKGVVVDCTVPKGDRKADRAVQEEVLRDRMRAILTPNKKSMDPRAFALFYEMTGFDLRTFSNNLEKLVLYVGERPAITAEDVTGALSKSRQEPIYEFTGAISDRNLPQALKLLDSVLNSGLHPLQVFAAMVNQVRKLLVAKAFLGSPQGKAWSPGIPYPVFTDRVLPAMAAFDQDLAGAYSAWCDRLEGEEAEGKKKSKKNKPPEDLLAAANPKNAYPLFLSLGKADNFRMEELTDFYLLLGEADMTLKRSSRSPKMIIEELLLKICRKG